MFTKFQWHEADQFRDIGPNRQMKGQRHFNIRYSPSQFVGRGIIMPFLSTIKLHHILHYSEYTKAILKSQTSQSWGIYSRPC